MSYHAHPKSLSKLIIALQTISIKKITESHYAMLHADLYFV